MPTSPTDSKRSMTTICTIAKWLVILAVLRDCLVRLAFRDVPSNKVGYFLGTKLLALANGICEFVLAFCSHLLFGIGTTLLQMLSSIQKTIELRQYFLYGHSTDTTPLASHLDLLCVGIVLIVLLHRPVGYLYRNCASCIGNATMKTGRDFVKVTRAFFHTITRPPVLKPLLIKRVVTCVIWPSLSQATLNLLPADLQPWAALFSGVAFSTTLVVLVYLAFPEETGDNKYNQKDTVGLLFVVPTTLALSVVTSYWAIVVCDATTPISTSYLHLVGILTHVVSVLSVLPAFL